MVELSKMVLISFTINAVFFFLIFAVLMIPGLNLIGTPFLVVGWSGVNLIMLLVCMFKCKMPSFSSYG